MAQVTHTGNGDVSNTNNLGYSFTFPSLSESAIKVSVNNVDKTVTTDYTIHNWSEPGNSNAYILFTSSTARGTGTVRIYRQTSGHILKHTFQAGSAIKANDLNKTNQQALYLAEEAREYVNNLSLTNGGSPIVVSGSNIADNSITTSKILDLQVGTADLSPGAVTSPKIGDTQIIDTKLANNSVITRTIKDGDVTQAKLNAALLTALQTTFSSPVGTVITFAGATAPTGYLKANGDTIPNGSGTVQGITANFSALYAIVGASLPDLRGEFVRGWDDGRGVDHTSNRQIRSTQVDDNKQHGHTATTTSTFTGAAHNHPYNITHTSTSATAWGNSHDARMGLIDTSGNDSTSSAFNIDSATATGTVVSNTSNAQQGSESRPRNVALLMCIKY